MHDISPRWWAGNVKFLRLLPFLVEIVPVNNQKW